MTVADVTIGVLTTSLDRWTATKAVEDALTFGLKDGSGPLKRNPIFLIIERPGDPYLSLILAFTRISPATAECRVNAAIALTDSRDLHN